MSHGDRKNKGVDVMDKAVFSTAGGVFIGLGLWSAAEIFAPGLVQSVVTFVGG